MRYYIVLIVAASLLLQGCSLRSKQDQKPESQKPTTQTEQSMTQEKTETASTNTNNSTNPKTPNPSVATPLPKENTNISTTNIKTPIQKPQQIIVANPNQPLGKLADGQLVKVKNSKTVYIVFHDHKTAATSMDTLEKLGLENAPILQITDAQLNTIRHGNPIIL